MKAETQKELIVLLTLIRATANQCLVIKDLGLRHLFKQSFKRIEAEAERLNKLIEKTDELNGKVFEEILDAVEDNIAEIRKSIKLEK
jgi:hypothetical protein